TSLQRIAAPEVANKAMISRYSGDITVTSSSASAFTSAAATPPPASPPAVSASGTGEDGAASTSSTVSRAICNRDSRSSARDNSSDRPAICSRSRSAWPSTSARLDSNASIKDGTPHPPSLSTRTPHGGLDPSDGKSRHNRPHPEPLRITPTRHPQKIYTHRGVLPRREERVRPRRVRGPPLPRLITARHPDHTSPGPTSLLCWVIG